MRAQVILIPAAALFLAGCDDLDLGVLDRYKEDFRQEHQLKPGGKILLEGFNGSVEIRSWEKDSVEVFGTKSASTEARLRDIKIDVDSTPDSLRIRATRPTGRGNSGVKFVLRVPKRVELSDIHTSNGAIRVEDIDGTATLRTSNGSVRVFRFNGKLRADTSNASIECSACVGGAYLRTSNGSISGELAKGAFEAITSNSSIELRLRETDPTQPIRLESSNGKIDLTLDTPRQLRAGTSNSSILLRLPASANANLRATTSNSSISSDFEVSTSGALSKNRLEGQIGSGGPLLELSTSNGSIKIYRQ